MLTTNLSCSDDVMSNSQTFDNQSFDYQEPQSSSSRKRPLPSSHHDNLFAKAHRASEEAGLVPLELSPGFKVLPCREFDKMKDAQNMGYHKKSCTYQSHRTKQVTCYLLLSCDYYDVIV